PENCARCAKCGHPVNGPAPREPFVVKQDHGVKSSQNPPPIDKCCCECGNALDGIFCQQCICKSCGKGAHIGYNCPPKVLIISNPEPCNQTINNELPQTLSSFDSAPCISKPNFVDKSSNIFNPPPQHPVYPCEFCGNDAYFGHYCIPKAQFNNPEQGYSQDFNFPQNIHNFQQQYFCCNQCGGPHETSQWDLMKPSNKQEEKRIEEEQAANARYWKIPACCDDDNDYDSVITPVLSTEETENSLSMGDEHLDTISATKSDEVIKSSVEDLVPIPSESKGESGCDVPSCFTTFSNIFFDADYGFESVDDQSLHNEDVSEKIFSNSLFEEEIISIWIDLHRINAESDLVESMLNRDSFVISSSKIDSLLDEFVGELTLLKSIPPEIDKADYHPKNEIRFSKRLLYDN
nr:hypothetical protein [Tanacetum cinerariifolium]